MQGLAERFIFDRSDKKAKFYIYTEQQADEIIRAAKAARDLLRPNTGPAQGKYLGTIPLILAQKWAQECGAAIGSKEFARYAKRKLKSNEFRDLRVHMK